MKERDSETGIEIVGETRERERERIGGGVGGGFLIVSAENHELASVSSF